MKTGIALILVTLALSAGAYAAENSPSEKNIILSTGQRAGKSGASACAAAYNFMKKCGGAVGEKSAALFVRQGKFWKRAAWSFAGFKESDAPSPRPVDQW